MSRKSAQDAEEIVGPPVRVIVDVRPSVNSHSGRGIGRYVRSLLVDCPGRLEVGRLTESRRWTLPHARRSPRGVHVVLPPRPRLRLDVLGARCARGPLERCRPDVVHLTDPYLYAEAPRGVRIVATLYDLIQWQGEGRLPDRFTRGVSHLLGRQDVRWVAISQTTRLDALRVLGMPAESVTVVPPGPTDWAPGPTVPSGELLVVGAIDEHKRPGHALEAAAMAGLGIRFAGRHEPHLVERWGLSPAQLVSAPDDATLAGLVRGATAVVHASQEEGFGLPVLEALSLGTPVVAYDLPVTREIVGPEYPLAQESDGPEGLAALARTFVEPGARAEALEAARPHLAQFDWARSRASLEQLWETTW